MGDRINTLPSCNPQVEKGIRKNFKLQVNPGNRENESQSEYTRKGHIIRPCDIVALYLCALYNMDYTSKSSFLERGKKVIWLGFK